MEKEYYSLTTDKTIFEVDKDLDKEEKSIQLLLDNVLDPVQFKIKNRQVDHYTKNLKVNFFHINFKLFKRIYIEDTKFNLIRCEDFTINYIVDLDNNKIIVKNIVFDMFSDDVYMNGISNSEEQRGKIHVFLEFNFNDTEEIKKVIDESLLEIISYIVSYRKIKLYKHFHHYGGIKFQNFINLFNKIEDEKIIKNHVIEKEFK